MWQGRVATTFYHSTSGGQDELERRGVARLARGSVPRLRRRSVRLALEVEPLGAVPAHAGGARWRGSALRQMSATSSSRADPPGCATEVTIKGANGVRRISGDDFRRALDLRSTWFSIRVLHLEEGEQPRARERADHRDAAWVRARAGQGAARAAGQRRDVADGRTRPAAGGRAVHGHRDGRRRTTSYRLATPVAAGAAVTVKAR